MISWDDVISGIHIRLFDGPGKPPVLATFGQTGYEGCMCTVVILRRPGHDWPVLIGANRDEMVDRHALAPARHWPDRGHVVAGQDELAGGTWLALNDDRVVAAILNRRDSLGPDPDKRSRGELPLEAVDHAEAREAARALAMLEPTSYRSFNMIIADTREAYWVKSDGYNVMTTPIQDGLSMITSRDLNSTADSSRMRYHLDRFRRAPSPDPDKDDGAAGGAGGAGGDWDVWKALLSSRETEPGASFRGAMNVTTDYGFGTVSSSLIGLPNVDRMGVAPQWHYCPGRPDEAKYAPVQLS